MSFSFDGTNDTMTGAFASVYNGYPCTLAAWIKIVNHPVVADRILNFGNNSGSQNDSHYIQTINVDDRWLATSTDGAAGSNDALVNLNVDGIWVAFVGRFTNATLRDVFLQALANTGTNGTSRVIADAMQFIRLGEGFTGAQDYTGKIAEPAIWKTALSDADITAYMNGNSALGIDASNLIGHWPLSAAGATQLNLGTDADGDLTVTGATFDADHPIIIPSSVVVPVGQVLT